MGMLNELLDEAGAPITSMGASFKSQCYEVGRNALLQVHMLWDNVAPTGTLYLEYSGVPCQDGSLIIPDSKWEQKSNFTIILDGSFKSQMFLDANLPAASFRIRFVHTAGNANLENHIKRSLN